MKGVFAKARGGFTLVEILVTTLVLGIVTYALAPLVVSSKLLLKKGYGRVEAMEIAAMKMEAVLALSYSGVASSQGTECLGRTGWVDVGSSAACKAQSARPFDWQVIVTNVNVGATPCKKMDVRVSYYDDETLQQTVSLVNYIPYPYIHVVSDSISGAGASAPAATPTYSLLYSAPLSFATQKNLQLSYNIAIRVKSATNIQPLDTIYTYARLVKGAAVIAQFYPETRTPILTQPLVNNWTELDGQNVQGCSLQILWRKETTVSNAGDIRLKMGNIVLIAVENS